MLSNHNSNRQEQHQEETAASDEQTLKIEEVFTSSTRRSGKYQNKNLFNLLVIIKKKFYF